MQWQNTNIWDRNSRPSGMVVIRRKNTFKQNQPVFSDVLIHDELRHYGILGQKWGTRRYQNDDGSLTEEGKQRYNKKPESATWRSKDAKYLSDAELNRRNNRLQKEKQYKDMTQTKASKAGKWIRKTLGTVLVVAAIEGIKQYNQQTVNNFVKTNVPKLMSTIAVSGMLRFGKINK